MYKHTMSQDYIVHNYNELKKTYHASVTSCVNDVTCPVYLVSGEVAQLVHEALVAFVILIQLHGDVQ